MAFQPIINLSTGSIFAHEALVRGTAGESAGSLLSQLKRWSLRLCIREVEGLPLQVIVDA